MNKGEAGQLASTQPILIQLRQFRCVVDGQLLADPSRSMEHVFVFCFVGGVDHVKGIAPTEQQGEKECRPQKESFNPKETTNYA